MPMLPVHPPSTYVEVTRLKCCIAGEMCSVPITTVRPGTLDVLVQQPDQQVLALDQGQQCAQGLRAAHGPRRPIRRSARGTPRTFHEEPILRSHALESRAGEPEHAGAKLVVEHPLLTELLDHGGRGPPTGATRRTPDSGTAPPARARRGLSTPRGRSSCARPGRPAWKPRRGCGSRRGGRTRCGGRCPKLPAASARTPGTAMPWRARGRRSTARRRAFPPGAGAPRPRASAACRGDVRATNRRSSGSRDRSGTRPADLCGWST